MLILSLICSSAQAQDQPRKTKNVLLIIADDLSANALGCYGNTVCQSPNIDALAKRSLLFENAYCQFPVCGPSRAAMMSGMYCQSNGVMGNGSSSKFTATMGQRPTMSQFFKDRGYYSARVSKIYHMRVPGDITAGVDGPDHLASWTERFNCQGPEWMSRGKHEHLTNEKLNRDPEKHYNLGFGGAFYSVKTASPTGKFQPDKLAADKAIEILNRQKDNAFFLAVGFVRPHVPLVAPESYFDAYPPGQMKLPKQLDKDLQDIPQAGIGKNSKKIGLTSKDKKQKVLQAYYASVTYMDHQVGRVLNELRRLRLDKETIVIFKSDHGYHLGEHEFWQKMSLHEESARIPLMISVPDMSRAVRTNSLTEAIDLYPTLAELLRSNPPPHCQGKSLVKLFTEPKHQLRSYAFSTTGKANLVRSPRYAYIRYRDKSEELYDMESDPSQFTNLANSPASESVVAEMRRQLDDHLAKVTSGSAKNKKKR